MNENDVTIELIGRSYEKLFWRSIHRKKHITEHGYVLFYR